MCGRFSLTASGEELAEAFGLDEPPEVAPRYNIAPSQPVLVVRRERGRSRATALRWGFPGGPDRGPGAEPRTGVSPRGPSAGIHSRREPPHGPELLINARSETVATRQAFRDSFKTRRCLVPADGFYEWKRARDGSDPFHVRRRDQRVFAFAGLWTPVPSPASAAGACVILTTEANALVASIHERMPVILSPDACALWLDDAATGDALESVLRPLPPAEIEVRAVSPAVNSAQNDGPQCQAPAPPRPVQGLLFPENDPP